MKRTFTRRDFTRMTAAAAAAAGLARTRTAALLAQNAPAQVEEPGAVAPEGVPGKPAANAPASSDPAAQWSGHDSPELIAAALANLPALPPGPFQPTWDSIQQNYKDPDWFRDAKFGIMMHWGIYSVPAHASEWYVRYMYGGNADVMQWHTEHYGPPTKFGYKDFLPMYTAAKWDPDAWAQLFKKAGAKYVLAPGEHHDGFSNWDSAINPYNAVNYGPHRDLDGDLIKAVRKVGTQDRNLRPLLLPLRLYPRACRAAMSTTRSGPPSTTSPTRAMRRASSSCTTGSPSGSRPSTSTSPTCCGST